MLLEEEFNNLFKKNYLNSKDLNTLIKKYKNARGERKFKLRDEVFYNVARLMRKRINNSHSIRNEDWDEAFHSSIFDFYTALNKYEVKRGVSFTTYLNYWITNSIQKFNYSKNIVKIGRGAFNSPLASTQKRANDSSNASMLYIDKLMSFNGEKIKVEIEDKGSGNLVTKKVEQESFYNFVRENLNETQFIVIKYRYLVNETWGLSDFYPVLHVGRESVRTIEENALNKLRKVIKNKHDFSGNVDSRQVYIPTEEELEANNQVVMKRKMALFTKKFV